MKYLLVMMFLLVGCNCQETSMPYEKDVREYTKNNPGVECKVVDSMMNRGTFKNGSEIIERALVYKCTDKKEIVTSIYSLE